MRQGQGLRSRSPERDGGLHHERLRPEFALWSFVDLGYLTYYVSYLLATGAIQGAEGEQFEAGRMGDYTIEKDPTRDAGLRVLMGPFTVYDKTNVEAAAQ